MSSHAENAAAKIDLAVETPSADIDAFKRASRLARSPNQTLTLNKPVHARSSPRQAKVVEEK